MRLSCECFRVSEKLLFGLFARYSRGTGSATPLIQAKTDDPSW